MLSIRVLRAAVPFLALALILPAQAAFATHVTTAANIPSSGIAPGHVNMATGELILVMHPDLALDGPVPVIFRRYYASMLAREGLASSHLGTNWLGTYDWSLSAGPAGVTVVTNRGKRIQFGFGPTGGLDLTSPTDENYKLTLGGGSYRLTYPSLRRIYLFDATSHLLTQIIDAHGNSLTLGYVGGRLAQVSDGLGRALTFGYDASGFLTMVSDGTRSVAFGYTGANLASFTDAASRVTNYSYSSASPIPGLLSSVFEPLGNAPLNYGYDPIGRVATFTDAISHTSSYSYDGPLGNFFSDPLANTWTFQHDAQDRLTSLTDPSTGPTSYAYDPQGRLSSWTRPMGDPTSFTYDPASGYVNAIMRADASVFSYEHLPHSVGGATLFDLSAAHYPDGTNESYMHDPAGNLIDFQDRGGFPWSWTYNGLGEVLTANNPAGGVTTFTYDTQGRPATHRDNAGNTTNYTFDSFSRLTQTGWPGGATRSFTYNNVDQLMTFTDERGKLWSYAYDNDHRLTGSTDPLLRTVQLVWDENDRVGQEIDPLGHATVYGYDADGRLSSVTDRTTHTTGFQYDGLHRLTGIINAASDTWSFSHDADSRMTSWQDPEGHVGLIGHDFLDQVTQVTDPVSSPFSFGYDSMGRLLDMTAPLGQSDVMTYDPRGLMASYRHVTSQVDLMRTPLGDVSQVTDPNHNPWPAGYDPQGRPTSDADPLGRTASYVYDTRSRLAHADLPVGAVTFTYDPASRLTDCQWLDGTTFTYTYDDANRLTGATGASFAYDAADRMTSSNGLTMGYDFEGRITSETYASGKVVSYTYDNRGLLTTMSDWVGGATSFTYDTAERLTGMTRPNGTSVEYAYDAADRLISAVEKQPGPISTPPLSSIVLTRDALGRPTSIDRRQPLMPVVTSPASVGFAYDPASQVTGLSWDGLARLTGDGARSFVWDGASRLTHYAAGADSPSFTYDAYGRMLSRSLGASSEQYVWNYAHGRPTLDVVYQGPTPRKFYVYTPGGALLYSVDAATGARLFYHYDEGGNTIFLTNSAGAVTTEYAYTPFGGMSALGATADNPFTWGGSFGVVQLGSGGLFRMGTSIYDASNARVVSGGAVKSGGQPGPVQTYASTNHREDFADAAAYYWLGPDQLGNAGSGSMVPEHETGHVINSHGQDRDPGWTPDEVYRTTPANPISIPAGGTRTFGNITFEGNEGKNGPKKAREWITKRQPPRPGDSPDASEPCILCPKNGPVTTKPMFTEIPKILVSAVMSLTANEPSFKHPIPNSGPTTEGLQPNLALVRVYGSRWLEESTRTFFEEEHSSRPSLPPPDHPRGPIFILAGARGEPGLSMFDPISAQLADYYFATAASSSGRRR